MTKEKYFSVDVSNEIHIINLHETEEQAKKSCLDCAIEAYEFAGDLDDFENYVEHDLPYAVYGVVLGRAKSDTRPLTDDELESGHYEGKSHFVEPPELIKVNRWISVEDKLPQNNLDCLVCYYDKFCGQTFIAISYFDIAKKEWDSLGYAALKVNTITHWQPLPELPK